MRSASVLFPAPDGPMRPTVCPARIVRLTSRRTDVSAEAYVKSTLHSSKDSNGGCSPSTAVGCVISSTGTGTTRARRSCWTRVVSTKRLPRSELNSRASDVDTGSRRIAAAANMPSVETAAAVLPSRNAVTPPSSTITLISVVSNE